MDMKLELAVEAVRELVDDLRRDALLMEFDLDELPPDRIVGNEAAAFIEAALPILLEVAKASGPLAERAVATLLGVR